MKKPLENRVFFAYPMFLGGGNIDLADDSNPRFKGRVLGDGTTQLTQYDFNSKGNITSPTAASLWKTVPRRCCAEYRLRALLG